MSDDNTGGGAFRPQPNARHCFVCGLESPVGLKLRFADNGADEVRAAYTVAPAYEGYPGVVHGGIVASMLDEAAGRAAMIADPNRFAFTGSLNIHYRQPVPVNTDLLIVGRMVRDRGRVIQAHSEIRLPDGAVAAEADATLFEMRGEQIPEGDLEALGWKIYPDDT